MKKILSAEARLDTLLAGLENQVLLSSDDSVLDDVDSADIRSVSQIIAGRLAQQVRSAARRAPNLVSASGKRSMGAFMMKPPVRPAGLSVAYSSDADDDGAAESKPDDRKSKRD